MTDRKQQKVKHRATQRELNRQGYEHVKGWVASGRDVKAFDRLVKKSSDEVERITREVQSDDGDA